MEMKRIFPNQPYGKTFVSMHRLRLISQGTAGRPLFESVF
jgi:hypothetical protein